MHMLMQEEGSEAASYELCEHADRQLGSWELILSHTLIGLGLSTYKLHLSEFFLPCIHGNVL